jgi:hypothetical protein
MKKLTLKELPDWPPLPGGAYDGSTQFPLAGEAVIDQVNPVTDSWVTFRGQFKGHPHSYHYQASSEEIANQIHEVVAANIGKTIVELGEFEIEV